MSDVECPYCDYRGPVESVEAHISGCCDENHRGEVGRTHREELIQKGRVAVEGDERATGVAEATTSEEGDQRESQGPQEGGTDGLPLPKLSPTTMVVLGVVVFAAVVLVTQLGGSSSGAGDDDQEDVEDAEGSGDTFDPAVPGQEVGA